MATWTSSWTNLSQINGGNQLTNNDVPTADIFNKTINNVGAVKDDLDDYKALKVSSWTSQPSHTRYPSEKLVKDSLNTISQNLTTLSNNTLTALNNINKKLSVSLNGLYYSYVENPSDGEGFTIVTIDKEDGVSARAQLVDDNFYFDFYSDDHFGTLDQSIGIRDLANRVEALGFKQGSFTITSSVNTTSITTSENKIVKQGKRCIANVSMKVTDTNQFRLNFTFDKTKYGDPDYLLLSYYYYGSGDSTQYFSIKCVKNGNSYQSPILQTMSSGNNFYIFGFGWELS